MSTVYAKTPKGQSELESRAGGLKPKVRRILIMIDGQRDLDEVTRLSASDEASVTEGIRQLLLEGYIDVAGQANRPPGALPTAVAAAGSEEEIAPIPVKPPPAPGTSATIIDTAAGNGPNVPPADPFGGIIKI